MKKFEYSVAIRTLGTAGEKYQKLLDSIKNSNIQPKNIFVVLPEGYEPPDYQIGTETFLYSKKGMVPQRIKALEFIKTEYTLFCDDDVEFDSTFVEKLAEPLVSKGYACSAGPLLDFFPPKGFKYLLASLLGGACKMLKNKEHNYVRILNTGGWSYNRDIKTTEHKIYDTDSLAGTCFMVKTQSMINAHIEDELWCEKTGYSAFEDRIIISKLKSNKCNICIVSDANYIHNDGKTSIRSLKLEPMYARAFNHFVYWHRFLYTPCKSVMKRLWLKICINYYISMSKVYNFLLLILKQTNKECLQATNKGFSDAKQYVKSSEYLELPKIN